MTTFTRPIDHMAEDELLHALLELLALCGWRAYHVRPSDPSEVLCLGSDGFPKIIAVHPLLHRLVAIECAPDRTLPSTGQLAWLLELRHHPTLEATIVRPGTYDAAIDWIRGRGPMPDARIR